ncbi:Transmembrane protein [Globisporangium polare]
MKQPATPPLDTLQQKQPGLELTPGAAAFNELKSPADLDMLEGGALRPGGTPSVFALGNIGLLAHIASVGVIYGTVLGVIYSVLNNYLYMSATLTATATALVRLPRALRLFAAVFTDCYPIFGYRRRPYLIMGWVMTFVSCFLMAVLPLGDPYYLDPSLSGKDESKMTAKQLALINHDAPNHGIKLIFLLMFANLGTVIAFGASDGVMVELAQREPEAIRGSVQNHVSSVRQVFMILSAFMTGLGLNGVDYGGSFSWTMGFNAIMGVCAFFAFITIPICWFCITEEKAERQSMRSFFVYLYELMQNRVIYQVIFFRFFRQVFSLFSVTASSPIQSTWAKVEPINDGIASMLSSLVTFFALFIVRKYGLHWSWQVVVIVCQFGVVFCDAIPTFMTIWNVYRSQWFWLGVPLLEEIPNSIGDFIATLFVVEVCDIGKEATVMGLMVSISAVGTPFATVMTKSVDAYFDIERKYIVKDDHTVRWQVTYAYIIAYAVNLFSVVFVFWLPRQKKEAQELKRSGGKSKLLGTITVCYLAFAFAWTIMTNILSLFASTKCLRIAGGTGCK